MSGSCGDGEGTVFLAHAWVPRPHRRHTVGSWHWWNVYKDEITARSQAERHASGWRCKAARWTVRAVSE